MTILIAETEPSYREIYKIEIWTSSFFTDFKKVLEPFMTGNTNYLVPSVRHLTILQKKGTKNPYNFEGTQKILYNPRYSIFYKRVWFMDIITYVSGWSTHYSIQKNPSFDHLDGAKFIEYIDSVLEIQDIPKEIVLEVIEFL
jgi:hypothetical protein